MSVEVTGRVTMLRRYPVKSMLGEQCATLDVNPPGVVGDRRYAFIDDETGRVATAKNPRLWRRLLQCSAVTAADGVVVTLPDGRTVPIDEAAEPVSELCGRKVHVADERSAGAVVERSDPIDVLTHGVDAEIEAALLEIAQGTSGGAFVDHSPVHLITTATLDAVGLGSDEALRYRPNIVIETPDGCPPFVENDWVGMTIRVGGVALDGTMPTPRCSVPTLEHGAMPRSPQAVRYPFEHNRVEAGDFGNLPCAGLYAAVSVGGTVREGDEVRID
ncbi:molybdenum cofactor biosysynthesis protein [Mycolicibacterium agri]|uniref:Molybdenum cofactor biosysynthesis protein n=1 Tax=Mycolicibacterium agri TaxID=36811 RepID=A0A2A7N3W6_MYCAG|nr:MOSC N-terminal beta barrel domain-containing protein [Mycolicibacterium agri]PEG38586.1 molybdenum cofactor biosysynthesis protein [Mycolicibacterium agri]GFG53542.1 molybdenum cofactor biosysynthesis protein [Mycolicibacterium agri]